MDVAKLCNLAACTLHALCGGVLLFGRAQQIKATRSQDREHCCSFAPVACTIKILSGICHVCCNPATMCAVPDSKMRMRRRAVRALISHTGNAIRDLRYDEDEMLRGAPSLSIKSAASCCDPSTWQSTAKRVPHCTACGR